MMERTGISFGVFLNAVTVAFVILVIPWSEGVSNAASPS